MINFPCPSCGAEVKFRSKVSVFGVCAYCRATLVRNDLNFETLGKMAELMPDMSPLQLGTGGVYNKKVFEIIGRVKISWSDGNWNEWYVAFDDGTFGWLAEAQGNYMVSFDISSTANFPPKEKLVSGQEYNIVGGKKFEIEDIKDAVLSGSEGELPFKAIYGEKTCCVDLIGDKGEFASLSYSGEGKFAYLGKYVPVEELKFSNLRSLDGWS